MKGGRRGSKAAQQRLLQLSATTVDPKKRREWM